MTTTMRRMPTSPRLLLRARPALALLLVAVLSAGCIGHLGSRAVPVDHFRYNQAIARSWEEQLLLNLVRLRYRDTPLFLEIGAVVSTFEVSGTVGASGGWGWGGGDRSSAGAIVGGSYTESPTVSYSPLQGEEFASRLLSPIPPLTLMLLSQSGWSISRLLSCCVQEINGLPNAVAAAGPTPDYVPDYADFQRLARVLRRLQIAGRLEASLEPESQTIQLRLRPARTPEEQAALDEMRSLLGLDPALDAYRLIAARRPSGPDEIAVMGRSLMASLYFVSQGVEAPAADEESGKVTVTRTPDGRRFEWSEVTGEILRIRSASAEPADAAVRVLHRGSWFYIADDDLTSKTTFSLLSFLFNLTAAGQGGQAPLLTYSLP